MAVNGYHLIFLLWNLGLNGPTLINIGESVVFLLFLPLQTQKFKIISFELMKRNFTSLERNQTATKEFAIKALDIQFKKSW